MSSLNTAAVKKYLIELQDIIVARLEQVDGRKFRSDSWDRPEGGPSSALRTGSGRSFILEEGNVLERGGVAFSHVTGDKLPPSATAHRPELAGRRWEAMGVSLVLHPRNPYAPATHLNVRMFVAMKEDEAPVFWFGGGMDLTPYYGFEEDAVHFHQTCKNSLVPFGNDLQRTELHPDRRIRHSDAHHRSTRECPAQRQSPSGDSCGYCGSGGVVRVIKHLFKLPNAYFFSFSHLAASSAKYVSIPPAPARLNASNDSSTHA